MSEVWKYIDGYDGKYMVSNKGNVKSMNYNHTGKPRLMKLTSVTYGYDSVDLTYGTKRKKHLVHRLVASAFIPNPENKKMIDHIDHNPKNNNVENLRWATCKENLNNLSEYGQQVKSDCGKSHQKLAVAKRKKRLMLDGVEFESCAEASRKTGIPIVTISQWCRGVRNAIGHDAYYLEVAQG